MGVGMARTEEFGRWRSCATSFHDVVETRVFAWVQLRMTALDGEELVRTCGGVPWRSRRMQVEYGEKGMPRWKQAKRSSPVLGRGGCSVNVAVRGGRER